MMQLSACELANGPAQAPDTPPMLLVVGSSAIFAAGLTLGLFIGRLRLR